MTPLPARSAPRASLVRLLLLGLLAIVLGAGLALGPGLVTPSHAATPNGCGPADGWYSALIPNRPLGYDFSTACDNHDICYGIAERGRRNPPAPSA